ncbi:MAG: dephospho-CoA kinase/protein folding accessory protein [Candidatus Eremiobacteraeota bacterium]|nr:dephospho-CoA kinase/protein folding accessory protein [Candidatus Eremiobacteraeota bacterium]
MPSDPISPAERAEPVVVVPYDAAWPRTFEAVRARIASHLGEVAVGIEHVGSTAVPGLDAKPIVDVDVVVRRDEDVPEAIRLLAAIGYAHLGDLGIAGREAFRAAPGLPSHHLYVCAAGAAALRAHLTLRDALRSDPELVAAYGALKRELAERYRDDRDSYVEGKTPFITAVLLDVREGTRRKLRRGG